MGQRISFVLAACEHGSMIVNRLDYRMVASDRGCGVGWDILETGVFCRTEINNVRTLLQLRRARHGDGVVALDCGANIGAFTVEWAREMAGWGSVIAIEAQERIFYALAGNIALNNCFNARAIHAAVAAANGTMGMPVPDYRRSGSFGSLELRRTERTEFIGQDIDYAPERLARVTTLTIDSLDLSRLDVIKLDVEGMEVEALEGAAHTIAALRPVIVAEQVKTDVARMTALLEDAGYRTFPLGMNLLAVHADDPVLPHIKVT
jgi:FkbM family methyltransferase